MIWLLVIIAATLAMVFYRLALIHASLARTADRHTAILQEIAGHCERMAQPLHRQDALDRMTKQDERRYQAAIAALERKAATKSE